MFHGFASHTSPSLIRAQYSDVNSKKRQQNRERDQSSFHPSRNLETFYDHPSKNQSGVTPIIYTEAHSELGIVQPRTAKKISTATSLNDFNTLQPQTGRVVFDMPRNNKKTMI